MCAILGQTKEGAGGNDGKIFDAQMAVSDPQKYPEFEGNVATAYSNPLSEDGVSNGYYGGNGETCMNIGEGMGEAMAELFIGGVTGFPV